jgi:hypothetical protein
MATADAHLLTIYFSLIAIRLYCRSSLVVAANSRRMLVASVLA